MRELKLTVDGDVAEGKSVLISKLKTFLEKEGYLVDIALINEKGVSVGSQDFYKKHIQEYQKVLPSRVMAAVESEAVGPLFYKAFLEENAKRQLDPVSVFIFERSK